MGAVDWKLIKKVYNHAEAEVIKGMLEAQGAEVLLAQEGAAKAIGINVGSLGEIQIHVRSEHEEMASQLVREFFSD